MSRQRRPRQKKKDRDAGLSPTHPKKGEREGKRREAQLEAGKAASGKQLGWCRGLFLAAAGRRADLNTRRPELVS